MPTPKIVIHKQVYKRSIFGGVLNTTLCGRESGIVEDRNVGDADSEVTCKLCLRIMQNPRHYRWNHVIAEEKVKGSVREDREASSVKGEVREAIGK